jgi:NhaP-type Na+/H+ and K+/H+ antiporter
MFSLEPMGWTILVAATLVMVSVLAGLVASRTGLPLLLIFLVIGCLAGGMVLVGLPWTTLHWP